MFGKIICWIRRRHTWKRIRTRMLLGANVISEQDSKYCTICKLVRPIKRRVTKVKV